MAKKRITMHKIRETLRLHYERHLSIRNIARAVSASRPAVTRYLAAFQKSGVSYSAAATMPDNDLLALFAVPKPAPQEQRYQTLAAYFPYLAREIRRRGVTLQLLWEEYIRKHPDGYNRSQFLYHFQAWRKADKVAMHIEHKAGEKMFTDYAGYKFKITDRESGVQRDAETFISILGASQYIFVTATESQSTRDNIGATSSALYFYGGAPAAIIPDNMKAAVTRADKYEPGINVAYADFASYYGIVVLPTRPYHPRDKALVENAVLIVYRRVYAPLRNRTFYSLAELNAAIHEQLEQLNQRTMRAFQKSRKELFIELEKETLAALPAQRYHYREPVTRRVQFNYHILLPEDKHYYSVPYRLKGQMVQMFYDDAMVEIFHNNLRVASHPRNRKNNGYSTKNEHMPPHHRFYADWSPERFIGWAQKLGGNVELVIRRILERSAHPEQGYKTCLGILNLSRPYGSERLDKACCRAVRHHAYSLLAIKNILSRNIDLLDDDPTLFDLPLPENHDNIRGSDYYAANS